MIYGIPVIVLMIWKKIHLKFIKSTPGVRKQTPTPAIYGDTGQFPLISRQHIKAVKY